MCKKFLFTITVFLFFSSLSFPNSTELFFDYQSVLVDSKIECVQSEDMNGDGRNDIIISISKIEGEINSSDFSFYIFYQKTDGSFESGVKYSGTNGLSFVVSDINSDSLPDLVFSSVYGVVIYFQNEDNTFSTSTVVGSRNLDFVVTGDFNNDSLIDIAALNSTVNNSDFYIYFQNQDGTFTAKTLSGIYSSYIRTGDINKDGKTDIVLMSPDPSTYSTIAVMFQTKNNSFSIPEYLNAQTGETGYAFAVGELFEMGQDGIILISGSTNDSLKLRYFYYNTDHFESFEFDYSSPVPDVIMLNDINNDNLNDLVILSKSSSELSIHLQNYNDSSFSTPITHSTEDTFNFSPYSLCISDLNNDFFPDILVACNLSDSSPFNGFLKYIHKPFDLLIPHIALESNWNTYLVLENSAKTVSKVLLHPYSNSQPDNYEEIYVYPDKSVHYDLTSGDWGFLSINGGNVTAKCVYENTDIDGQGIAEFYLSPDTYKSLEYVLPNYISNELTWIGISILNPNPDEADITLTAYNTAGVIIGTESFQLQAYTKIAKTLDYFFDDINIFDIARINATSTLPINGINISGSNFDRLLFTPAVGESFTGQINIPHIAPIEESWDSLLIADNIGPNEEFMGVEIFSDGLSLGTYNFSVNPYSNSVIDLNTLSQAQGECGFVYNDSENLILRQSFVNTSTNGRGTAEFLLNNLNSNYLLFTYPYFMTDIINWRGIAVFNPTNSDVEATFKALSTTKVLGVVTKTIEARHKYAITLTDLFPNTDPELLMDTSTITVTSNSKLNGINISGHNFDRLLFGTAIIK